MRGHADAETLAAFREELLPRRKAARVSAHLTACSRCAGLDAQLSEVPALLTRSTTPPMPDALAARIQAAIAAEAAARAATATDGTVAVGAAGAGAGARDRAARPSRQSGGPGRSRLVLRVAAVTAAVVVVAGGGYGVARLLSGNPGSSTGTGSPAAPTLPGNGKAPRMSGAIGAPGNRAAASGASPLRVISSGTNYQPGQLKAQVSSVLTQHGGTATAGPAPSPGHRPAAAPRPQPGCIRQATGGKQPLLVDQARYQGRPASIIVIPGSAPGTLRAVVVAGRCTATASHILAATTLPAPG